MNKQRKNTVLLKVALAVLCIGVIVQTVCMAEYSALSWTFHQTEYWKAIAEILIYYILLAGGQLLLRKKQPYARVYVLCLILFFSYTHQYLIAMGSCALYMLFLYLFGTAVSDGFRLNDICESWQSKMILGIAADFVLVAGASTLKCGTPEKLRIIIPIALIVLLLIERKRVKQWIIDRENNYTKIVLSKNDICLFSGIVVFILAQIGRANISLDYDSTWYGLRSAYMLAPKTGIYDEMPFLACVHTYAKGAEVLMLPFAGTASLCAVYAVNILFGVATIRCVYDICKKQVGQTAGLFAALCVSAIPGIMNMTVTAKSDILTLFLEVAAIYFMLEGIQKKRAEEYMTALSACMLSLAFKSSSVIFSSVVAFVVIIVWSVRKTPFQGKIYKSGLYLLCACVGLGVIWTRTWILTGTPFTFLLPGVIRAVGGTIKYPYDFYLTGTGSMSDLLNPTFLISRLKRVLYILFYPTVEETDHIIFAWGGPVFVVLFGVLVIWLILHFWRNCCSILSMNEAGALHLLFVLLSGVVFGCALLLGKPDGNYFDLLYAVSAIAFIESIDGQCFGFCKARLLVCVVIASAMLISISSSWAWTVGFTEFRIVNKGYYDNSDDIENYMNDASLTNIYEKLQAENKPKVEIFSSRMQYAAFIPATCDLWHTHRTYGKTSTATEKAYVEYLQFSKMDYLLVEKSYLFDDTSAEKMLVSLAQDGYLEVSQTTDAWALMKVTDHASKENIAEAIKWLYGPTVTVMRGLYDDNWAAQELEFAVKSRQDITFHLTGNYPIELEHEEIDVLVDDKLIGSYAAKDNRISIQVALEAGQHTVKCVSKSSFHATPPDVRDDLSFVLTDYLFE